MTNSPNILLVEDEQQLRCTLEEQLGLLGFSILPVTNGVEAMAILEEKAEEIDVVVSDWMMGEMTGLQLLEKMRSESRYRTIPFLMLTAKGFESDVLTGFNAGANDFVKKPFNLNEFIARVSNLAKNMEMQRALKELAVRDELTNLYNYRHFSAQLNREIERHERYGGALSLLFFDIDHFKKFNDEHGHVTGDSILHDMGKLILDSCRKVDIPCRYGGEEFAVILPGTGLEGANIFAERLRVTIEKNHFSGNEAPCFVTCSFGVSECCSGENSLDFVQRVDRGLYVSKEEGRNKVTVMPQIDPSIV